MSRLSAYRASLVSFNHHERHSPSHSQGRDGNAKSASLSETGVFIPSAGMPAFSTQLLGMM